MSRIAFEGDNESQNDDAIRLTTKKRKLGSAQNILESCENTLSYREDARSMESLSQAGQKRKRNIAQTNAKEAPSPSPVKVFRKSSTSLRAAMTKMQKDRKPLPNFNVLFGRPLSEVALPENGDIPLVVSEAIAFLIPKYLGEEGLFRKSGSAQAIQQLRASIDATGNVRELIQAEIDCHAIAGVLKLYVRELPSSVIPVPLQSKFLSAIKLNQDVQSEIFLEALAELPPQEYALLKLLCLTNYQIAFNHETNLMTANNLARVWAPNLLKMESTNPVEIMQFTEQANILMTLLIDQAPNLFRQESEGSDDGACMAASASYEDNTTSSCSTNARSRSSLLGSTSSLGASMESIQCKTRSNEMAVEPSVNDELMMVDEDGGTEIVWTKNKLDGGRLESKTLSLNSTASKRKGLIKKTSVIGKALIKGTPLKQADDISTNKETIDQELLLELRSLAAAHNLATNPGNQSESQSQFNPSATASTTILNNPTPSPMRATPTPMVRTRSAVFKESLRRNLTANGSNPHIATNNTNSETTSQRHSTGPVVTFADMMPSGMEASQACSNEGEASTGESGTLKKSSSCKSIEPSAKKEIVKPKVSLLYYEPGTIAFLDRALSEQSLLEVPKARVRVDSKHAVSVEEATRLVRACQKLIVIGANDTISASRTIASMTDLDIKKTVIDLDTFNLTCPSITLKTSRKDSVMLCGFSQTIWQAVLENEDADYLLY